MIGVSEIKAVIPSHFIGSKNIAKSQNLSLNYVTEGLGVKESRFLYKESLEELIVKALKKINYQNAGRFILASESDKDLSKASLSLSAVNEQLGLRTVPFQLKFACLSGIQGLLNACEYVYSHNKPAILIAADRSLYKKGKAGATQGAGVVVMKIEKNPKLLEIDFQNYGEYAENIDDFKVPFQSAPFPKVNGSLTKPAYIKCVLNSLEKYKEIKLKEKSLIKSVDYFVFHSPFPKMVLWAAASLWKSEKDPDGHFKSLLNQSIENSTLFKKAKKIFDQARINPKFKNFFQEKIQKGLIYNPYIGNCYTASIFISLISILEKSKKGQNICLVGYGSGAGSIALGGTRKSMIFKSDLSEQIDQGQAITLSQYQKWFKNIN